MNVHALVGRNWLGRATRVSNSSSQDALLCAVQGVARPEASHSKRRLARILTSMRRRKHVNESRYLLKWNVNIVKQWLRRSLKKNGLRF